MNSYIITSDAITVFTAGRSFTVTDDHPKYKEVLEAIKAKDFETIPALADYRVALNKVAPNRVVIDNNQVLLDGKPVHPVIAQRILNQAHLGLSIENLSNFLIRLEENPSSSAREELYLWLETSKLPINEDGTFLAYKVVRDDYKDKYTGTMDNSVGAEPSMPRRDVDDDRRRTCSRGLHFCSLDYLNAYGRMGSDRVMILEVDPANVVSIPNDYGNKKGRAWTYKVVAEYNEYNWQAPTDWNSDDEEDEWDETSSDPLLDVEVVALSNDGDVVYQTVTVSAYDEDDARETFWDEGGLQSVDNLNEESVTIRRILRHQA